MCIRDSVSTDPKNSTAIARRLIKQGYDLEGVPGFFVNNSGDWEIAFYRKNNGYLCPVWSEEGLLTAFQIRLDPPNSKYIWLASTKFQRGCSSGCPVSLSGNPYAKRVYAVSYTHLDVYKRQSYCCRYSRVSVCKMYSLGFLVFINSLLFGYILFCLSCFAH